MSTIQMTPCPSWCDRSHETRTDAGDLIHTTTEYHFEGREGGAEEVYLLAEISSDNRGTAGYVTIDGARLRPSDARLLAIQLLQLADIAEDR